MEGAEANVRMGKESASRRRVLLSVDVHQPLLKRKNAEVKDQNHPDYWIPRPVHGEIKEAEVMVTMSCFETNEEWLKARTLIGGSDAAALVGMSPYKTNIDLWMEKTGRKAAPDISNEPFVRFGHEAEPYLRKLFALDHPQYEVGYKENNIFRNDKYPYAHASLDGWLLEKETGRLGVLEIKTTNILQSMHREKWNDRIPDNYFCQVLWYLMVTEFDFAILKARLRSEWQDGVRVTIRHYMIERSEVEANIEELRKAGEKFWKAIQEDREPNLILPAI